MKSKMVIVQKISAGPENTSENHPDLFNTILEQTLKKIENFLKNRDIEFGYLPDFIINPQRYPGNKSTGLRQISEKFLQDIISKYYFKIQTEGLFVNFVYNSLIKTLFQKGIEFNKTSQITVATRGGDDARKAVSTSRIDEPPRLLIVKKKAPKVRVKSNSNIISKKKIKQVTTSKMGRKGLCEYCGARTKPRPTRNTTHINISQNPTHHRFCSKECKIAWIFGLNEINSQEG